MTFLVLSIDTPSTEVQNLPRAPPRGGGNFLKNSKNREILEKPADEKRIQWGNFSKNIFARGEIFGFLEDSAPLN